MSSIIRIIVGVALITGVVVVYSQNSAQIAAGGQVCIFGMSAGTAGWLVPAFIIVGIIGLVFVGVGVGCLMRNRK